MPDIEIELAVLRSHCARKDQPQSHCMGQVTITSAGVQLSCKLCGDASLDSLPYQGAHDRARAIIESAGIRWDALSIESRHNAAQEASKDTCPGCGRTMILVHSYMQCVCGKWIWSIAGWHKENKINEL